jgi:DNA-binding PadR family transcriptional regulator
LVKHLDRSAFFPSQLSENISSLFKHNLIEISERFSNGDPFKYTITKHGIEYLDQNLRRAELMSFADTYSHKNFIIQMIPVLLEKRIADGKILDRE